MLQTSGALTVQAGRAGSRGWVDVACGIAVLLSRYHLMGCWEHRPGAHSPGTAHLCQQPEGFSLGPA